MIIRESDIKYYDDYLMHYGKLGMKWGRRKQNKLAKKDAKEFARAKMFYGEGAGTRRKLIKATVNQRSKDPTYKKAFEKHLSNQDMAYHATKARGERKRKDVKQKTAKTARGLVNAATGNIARASAAAATLYMVGHYTGANKKVAKYLKKGYSVAKANASGAYKLGKMWLKANLRRG